MWVISKKMLNAAVERLPKSQQPAAQTAYDAWHKVAEKAAWGSYSEVKLTFNTADQVSGKLVLDVGGNKHRIVAVPGYKSKKLFLIWAGSHKEYDKIDVAKL